MILTFQQVDEPHEKRDYVIKELVDTERNYVEVLCKLKNNFMSKLLNFIPKENLDIIFYHIHVSYQFLIIIGELKTAIYDQDISILLICRSCMTYTKNF